MQPRLTVLTLGVDDLERSLRFYREGLGLPSDGITGTEHEHGAVAFFPLRGDLILALYPRTEIAWDAKVEERPPSATEFTLGHNVGSRAEVDRVLARARAAGARITKPPGPTFWGGYSGYFQDPDGHLWEVAWNPQIRIDDAPETRARRSERTRGVRGPTLVRSRAIGRRRRATEAVPARATRRTAGRRATTRGRDRSATTSARTDRSGPPGRAT